MAYQHLTAETVPVSALSPAQRRRVSHGKGWMAKPVANGRYYYLKRASTPEHAENLHSRGYRLITGA